MKKIFLTIAAVTFLSASFTSCREKTAGEKVEDSIENAADETGDAIEDAADEVEDAVD